MGLVIVLSILFVTILAFALCRIAQNSDKSLDRHLWEHTLKRGKK